MEELILGIKLEFKDNLPSIVAGAKAALNELSILASAGGASSGELVAAGNQIASLASAAIASTKASTADAQREVTSLKREMGRLAGKGTALGAAYQEVQPDVKPSAAFFKPGAESPQDAAASTRAREIREYKQATSKIQEKLAADEAYIQAEVVIARSLAVQASKIQESLAFDDEYIQAKIKTASSLATQQAFIQTELAGEQEYIDAQVLIARGRQQQAALIATGVAADQDNIDATVLEALGKRQKAAKVAAGEAADQDNIDATVLESRAKRQKAAKLAVGEAADADNIEATILESRAKKVKAARVAEGQAIDADAIQATAATTIANRARQAAELEIVAADQTYAAATARAAIARQEQAARASIEQAAIAQPQLLREGDRSLKGEALVARGAALKKAQADIRAAAATGARSDADIQETVQARAAEAKMRAAITQRERAYLKDALATGKIDSGTKFQNLQARFSPAAGKLPSEFQTIGQFVGQKVTNTVGYGIGGLAIGGTIAGLSDLVKTSGEFEQTLVRLHGQLDTLGKGDSFEGMRTSIKAIAADTGASANDVAVFARRMVGVFGDPEKALTETASAMKLAKIAGLDLDGMMTTLVPISKNFGVSIEQIGDLAVSISEKFGLAEDATVSFLGKASATAKEAGLSMNQLAIIGANMANSLGKPLDASADVFNKMPALLQNNQERIVNSLNSRPQTQQYVNPIIDQIGAGDTGQALITLMRSYDKLDATQRRVLLNSVASRRDQEEAAAMFENSAKTIRDLDADAAGATNVDKLNNRFKDMRGTLVNVGDRLHQVFDSLGETLFSAGLADTFVQIGDAAGQLVGVVAALANGFKALNDATKFGGAIENGMLVTLGEMALLGLAAVKVLGLLGLSKKANATASQEQVLSETELNGAIIRTTVVTEGNTAATGANAAVKGVNAASNQILSDSYALNSASSVEGLYGATGPGGIAGKLAGSARAQRWLGGGTALQSRLLGSGTQAGIEAGAAEAGTATGVGLASGVGIAALGIFAVKQARDSESEKLNAAAADLREQMKGKSKEKLQVIAGQYHDFWDNVQHNVLGVDLPGSLAQAEIERQDAATSVTNVGGLIKAGAVGDFTGKVKDENLKHINDFLNQNQESQKLATDLGVTFDRGKAEELGALFDVNTGGETRFRGTANLSADKLKEILPKIHEKALNNEAGYVDLEKGINNILETQANMADIRKRVAEANEATDTKKLFDDAAAAGTTVAALTYEDAKGKFAAGEMSASDYIKSIENSTALLRRQLVGQEGTDAGKANLVVINAKEKESREVRDKMYQKRAADIKLISKYTSDTPAADALKADLAILPHLSHDAQVAAVPGLLEEQHAKFEEYVLSIADPVARAAAKLKGEKIDPRILDATLPKQFQGDSGNALLDEFEKKASETHQSLQTIELKWVDEQLRLAKLLHDNGAISDKDFNAANDAFNLLKGLINDAGGITKPKGDADADSGNVNATNLVTTQLAAAQGQLKLRTSKVAGDPIAVAEAAHKDALLAYNAALQKQALHTDTAGEVDTALAAVNDTSRGIASATDDLAKTTRQWATVMANGDPVLENAAKMNDAREALKIALRDGNKAAAQQALQDIQSAAFEGTRNDQAIVKANHGVTAALAERSPVETARLALEAARYDETIAVGTAAKADAAAARIRAEHGYQDALSNLASAQSNLVITMANAVGDSVAAAQEGLNEARRKLAEAEAQTNDETVLKPLRGNVATASAALVSSRISTQQDTIDFMMQMGQITIGQAIQQYQALLNTQDITQAEFRSLQLKIRQLQQQSDANYQFNLPTNLALPTLYESRRVNQSNQQGIGYQDNRNLTLAVTVNGTTNPAAVANQVMGAFQAAANGGAVYAPASTGVNV